MTCSGTARGKIGGEMWRRDNRAGYRLSYGLGMVRRGIPHRLCGLLLL